MSRTSATPACTTRHAVILTAGESKRTRPLTLHRPKPLIPLLGTPLLAHILDEMVGLIERVTLVVGYRAEMIRATFGDNYRGIALRYVQQTVVNGTAGALLAAAPIDEPFFVLYGDNLIAHADLLGVCHERYCMAALPVADARSFGVLQIDADRVVGILEKPEQPPPQPLANPGIFHFDPDVFALVAQIRPSPRGELELTDLIGLLDQSSRVGYHVCQGHWVPVGNPWEALNAVRFLLERRNDWRTQIDPAAEIAADVELEGSLWIGAARIGSGSRISGPVVIGAGCTIGSGVLIHAAVIEPGAVIADGAVIRDSVIGAQAQVGAESELEACWIDDAAVIERDVLLPARAFPAQVPPIETTGLLGTERLVQRGVVLAAQAHIAAGTRIEPGSVLFRTNDGS
jgi:NDP-sugar pyrophosphorylase family protein